MDPSFRTRKVKRIQTNECISLRGTPVFSIHAEKHHVSMELGPEGVWMVGQTKTTHIEKLIPFSNLSEIDLYPAGPRLMPIDRV